MFDKNKIEFFLFSAFIKFFKFLGFYKARRSAGFLAYLFYYLIPIRKKVVHENLSRAFPQKSAEEIKKIALKNYRSFLITLIEILTVDTLSKKEIEDLTEVDLELIRKFYDQENGVIFLTAHFGSWEMAGLSVASKLGVPFSVLAKPMRNPFVNKVLDDTRVLLGNKVVKLGASVKEIYKEIKEKRIVALVGDQRGSKEGLRVDYFGISTAVYSGTAAIALKTGAPILVGMIKRAGDYKYKIELNEIKYGEFEGSNEEKIKRITQEYMAILENAVRENPEQWFWMHKIWKY